MEPRILITHIGEDGCTGFVGASSTRMRFIASWGGGWDHVSVSLPGRCPTWNEMDLAHKLFFLPNEWAVQYHVPIEKNISLHPYCLHIWRPQEEVLPIPPKEMVG